MGSTWGAESHMDAQELRLWECNVGVRDGLGTCVRSLVGICARGWRGNSLREVRVCYDGFGHIL